MKFFSFDYMEDKEPCILEEDIIFTPFSSGIELAETVDLNYHLHQAYREITLVRVKNKGVTVELAFWCFAGITEDEESQKLMLEDWELKYGRFNWKERRKKR